MSLRWGGGDGGYRFYIVAIFHIIICAYLGLVIGNYLPDGMYESLLPESGEGLLLAHLGWRHCGDDRRLCVSTQAVLQDSEKKGAPNYRL